jgi:hypothetical protein
MHRKIRRIQARRNQKGQVAEQRKKVAASLTQHHPITASAVDGIKMQCNCSFNQSEKGVCILRENPKASTR